MHAGPLPGVDARVIHPETMYSSSRFVIQADLGHRPYEFAAPGPSFCRRQRHDRRPAPNVLLSNQAFCGGSRDAYVQKGLQAAGWLEAWLAIEDSVNVECGELVSTFFHRSSMAQPSHGSAAFCNSECAVCNARQAATRPHVDLIHTSIEY